MSDIQSYNQKTFEAIKHIGADGSEFWYARELQKVLEYTQWRRFNEAIERAKEACENSKIPVRDHFAEVGKTIKMPKGAEKVISDIMLSRYACYLIVQNGDPKKEVIAAGQTYFAVKTRQQEIMENYENLSEDKKRILTRSELIEHNKSLADAANMAGVRITPYFKTKAIKACITDWGQKKFMRARA